MAVYSVRGFTAATAATADHTVFQLWNPDGAQRIRLLELGMYHAGDMTTAIPRYYVSRTSTTGTAGSTVTPDADNCWDRVDTPPSGALLYLAAFTAQPTLLAPPLRGWTGNTQTGNAGTGAVWTWSLEDDFWILPGTGVAVTQGTTQVTTTSEVYVVFEEN